MEQHFRRRDTSRAGRVLARTFTSAGVIGWLAFVLALPAQGRPHFVDVTERAGVVYQQHVPRQFPNCMFGTVRCHSERMSGGAAVGDFDGDGDPDLYVTRLDAPDILFRNLGDGSFEDATGAAGLAGFDLQSNGAAFGDLDNDGDSDLYVTVMGATDDVTNGRNRLFMNQGDGTFKEEAVARGAGMGGGGPRRPYSVALGDYDRDGWLDLHVNEWAPEGTSNSRLLRNLGVSSPGFFEDVTAAAGVVLDDVHAFASAFVDLDADGWPDLAVAADFLTSRLFWNNGDGTFTDGTFQAGVGTDENGMGSTFADFDGDGRLDWFVTSIYDPNETCEGEPCGWGYTGNRLYRNEGGRSFSDATDGAGVRNGHWGWGAAFLDYDNDGDSDLAMTNGVEFPGTAFDAAFNADPMRLWENDGAGAMTEVSALRGLTDTGSGKGLLVFDYDEDGDLDIFAVNNASEPRLYRNNGGSAFGWLRVKLVGTASNRDGYGARVAVQLQPGEPTQIREIGATTTHFLGQSERIAHFGLGPGSAPVSSVTIEWPSGTTQHFTAVARNTVLVAVEPVSVPMLTLPSIALLVLLLLGAARWTLSRRGIRRQYGDGTLPESLGDASPKAKTYLRV